MWYISRITFSTVIWQLQGKWLYSNGLSNAGLFSKQLFTNIFTKLSMSEYYLIMKLEAKCLYIAFDLLLVLREILIILTIVRLLALHDSIKKFLIFLSLAIIIFILITISTGSALLLWGSKVKMSSSLKLVQPREHCQLTK